MMTEFGDVDAVIYSTLHINTLSPGSLITGILLWSEIGCRREKSPPAAAISPCLISSTHPTHT